MYYSSARGMPASTIAGGGWNVLKQAVGEDGVRDREDEVPDGLLAD